MGYVFDFKEAGEYDAGFDRGVNRYYRDLEVKLFLKLLKPRPGQRVLDIGCGSGISLEPLLDRGLNLTGLDPSPYMLDRALDRIGERADFHRGFAEDLPFDDNAFDTAFFFTSLEFSNRPAKAIEEACRVAKDQVVICVFNGYAPLNIYRRFKGYFIPSHFTHMRFFSIWELKRMIFNTLGHVPVSWRTTLQCPLIRGRWMAGIEKFSLIQHSPFGSFIAMRIKPVPTFRTRPLALKIRRGKLYNPASGLVTGCHREKNNGLV